MLDTAILDIAIGLCLLYMILSLVCTMATEWISAFLKMRSKKLEMAIRHMLGTQAAVDGADVDTTGPTDKQNGAKARTLADDFFDHGRLKGLNQPNLLSSILPILRGDIPKTYKPSSISANVFAETLLGILEKKMKSTTIHGAPAPLNTDRFVELVRESANLDSQVKAALESMFNAGAKDMEEVKRKLEGWFNDTMDSAEEWFKKWAQLINFILAGLICILLNADTFKMAEGISKDAALRTALVGVASSVASHPELDNERLVASLESEINNNPAFALPLGWTHSLSEYSEFLCKTGFYLGLLLAIKKLLGITVSIFAVSLGAQFWFDAVGKLINMRMSGKNPLKLAPSQPKPGPAPATPQVAAPTPLTP